MKTLRVLLTLVPVAGVLAGVFFANRTEPMILGLPFLLFWIAAWAVAGALIMGIVYLLDPVNRRKED